MINKLKKLAHEPLIHFLLIGAAIYALYGFYVGGGGDDRERTVTVTSGEVQSLADQFHRLWNRQPTEAELANTIDAHVRTQILYREAVAMGLDVGDTVIERRLAQRVEMLAQGLMTPTEPSDEVLATWYVANPDGFRQPDRYTVAQVFFDPEKRGDKTLDDAQLVLNQLRALDAVPENIGAYGDRFMHQNYHPNESELGLSNLYGAAFAEQLVGLEPGAWHGPILSGYGTHLVWVSEVIIAPQPALEEIREQVREAWMAEQTTELSQRFIDNLVSRYEIVVEETELPLTIPGGGATQ